MGLLGLALLLTGVTVFLYGFANTNITAPQESDPGNRYIWPGILTAAAGLLLMLVRLGLFVLSYF